ncbi:neutral zinc metallopeptidase [Nocardia yamanashiensis]|uniref:neutral zinc metallopeptidase n=1 Tax=Nocardia yamanashiensis TaxID=209247 RepID=UPI000AC31BEA|nr:neutral zinc metallopeptidase [Nocardia yamanashiensis]
MRMSRLRAGCAVVLLTLGVALTGCDLLPESGSQQVTGNPGNPFELNGSESSTGPSGPRSGVPDATLTADNSDGGAVDRLALNAIADVQEYWNTEYAKIFPGKFTPVSRFISWDVRAGRSQSVQFCRESTYQEINAAYCGLDQSIGWDRGVLLPELSKKFGDMSVVFVLAHEYGHAVQEQARLNGLFTPTVVKEQQADCFAGVFIRHVAEGNSRHFTINTTDGLNGVLGAAVAVRDQEPGASENEHGTGFERVTAFEIGYTDGAAKCKNMTRAELEQRRGTLPTSFGFGEKGAQLTVDRSSLEQVAQALAVNYPVTSAPRFDYNGVTKRCSNVTTTQPVSYCPATNTIGADVTALAKRARGDDDTELLSSMVAGDYNAFVVFVSRYMLAVQQDRKLGLTGADTAGLRTACLSGAFSTKLSQPGSTLQLSADDLDEAVSGLLSDGIAAADVDGKVVASGFVRLQAFRTGVLDGETSCLSTYK